MPVPDARRRPWRRRPRRSTPRRRRSRQGNATPAGRRTRSPAQTTCRAGGWPHDRPAPRRPGPLSGPPAPSGHLPTRVSRAWSDSLKGVPDSLLSALADRILVADGAMGTMLQAADVALDDFDGYEGCNEVLNVTRP